MGYMPQGLSLVTGGKHQSLNVKSVQLTQGTFGDGSDMVEGQIPQDRASEMIGSVESYCGQWRTVGFCVQLNRSYAFAWTLLKFEKCLCCSCSWTSLGI